MKVAFDLPPAQAETLKPEASRLGLSPDDLARAALADLLWPGKTTIFALRISSTAR
jgi:hypothetical protein